MKHYRNIVNKSFYYSFSIIAGASTVAGILGYTVRDLNPKMSWWLWVLILFGVFLLFSVLFFLISISRAHKPYTTTINGKPVEIKIGDIFEDKGLKVIPFNERFDTKVDDIVIAHNSLNGKMIDQYIEDKQSLDEAIHNAEKDLSELEPEFVNGRVVYPLGRLIQYQDFLMLAFSHFDAQNRSYIGVGEYELMLTRMWSEMRRVYAAKHVSIPLLGTGITTISESNQKDYTGMLKCILCTLKASKFQSDQGISILLTKEAIKKVDMNIIKEEF